MALSTRRTAGGFREINVTPLVDVMLVLLIVFMVTAPLLTAGVEVKLPQAQADVTKAEDPQRVLVVRADGRVSLGDRDVTDDVRGALLADAAIQRARSVAVRADKDARYESVARALSAARRAGVTTLDLVVEAKDGAR
jgi:biopolymer transport protein TolR